MSKTNGKERWRVYCEYDSVMESRKWAIDIPFIKFPRSWQVKAIPPFAGAVIRYVIKTPKNDWVSVYLDCYDHIGLYGSPYWEVYPHKGDIFRCDMKDVDALLKAIKESRKR